MPPLPKVAPSEEDEDDLSVIGSESHEEDSSTTDRQTTTGTSDNDKEIEQKMNLARKETMAVFRLRMLVFCVLMLASGKSDLLETDL